MRRSVFTGCVAWKLAYEVIEGSRTGVADKMHMQIAAMLQCKSEKNLMTGQGVGAECCG